MTPPLDTDAIRAQWLGASASMARRFPAMATAQIAILCAEVDRLRSALAAAAAHASEASDYADRYKAEVDRLRAENAALTAIAEWAQDAPHHDGCNGRFNGPHGTPPQYRCKCGRDAALVTRKADQ